MEIMKQNNNSPMDASMEVSVLWALKNGIFDDINIKRVGEASTKLQQHLRRFSADLLAEISRKGEFDEALEKALGEACAQWRKRFA